jgi:uncharacterized membrane protein YkoI
MSPRLATRRALLRAAVSGAAILLAGQAAAARRHSASGRSVGLDEAVAMVQARFGGRVLAASSSIRRGREGWRIRVMTEDGRVYTVFVDAASGAMSES